jgi:hypothetical protein
MPHIWFPILVSKLISLLQATSLRERYYLQQQRIELLETAIDDIDRINQASAANELISGICARIRR